MPRSGRGLWVTKEDDVDAGWLCKTRENNGQRDTRRELYDKESESEGDGGRVDGNGDDERDKRKKVVGKRVKRKRKRKRESERLRRESEDEEKDEQVDPGGGISKCAVQRLGGAAFFEGWLALNNNNNTTAFQGTK
ncbi:hypothetical protein TRV_03814 [Trichophyton verrucosum HKI 0517]|uniref:Uncharacterized protein n=1 Tax=Trichophyton verrucosum (strain HKI 0517) TaxID=663202 RepID=D4D9M1_TRIVH|nr:uncharacterized protein TRV_03814 [Trichophyton verrucosum HKI 0517]EFE41455.1 hypothetical protein TRV_03814 [Trichophyton verrucosum HKI 0517]